MSLSFDLTLRKRVPVNGFLLGTELRFLRTNAVAFARSFTLVPRIRSDVQHCRQIADLAGVLIRLQVDRYISLTRRPRVPNLLV